MKGASNRNMDTPCINRVILVGFLREIARVRMELHKDHSSSRPLSADYEYIGLLGEWEFSQKYGLPIDLTLRSGGDGRKDFTTGIGTIDVKTANKAFNLLRETNKPHADILVLAQYLEEDDNVAFLGWEYDKNMVLCPHQDFGYGIDNYYKSWQELRTMSSLGKLLTR
jgi:hypothetical protein